MGDIIGLVLTLLWGGSKVLSGCLFLPASENSTVRARGKTKKYSFVGAVRNSVAWHHLQYQVGWSLLICRSLGGLISQKGQSLPSPFRMALVPFPLRRRTSPPLVRWHSFT